MSDVRDGYSLLDFGDGRKLERFGPVTTARPAPGAGTAPASDASAWNAAAAEYVRTAPGAGAWRVRGELPERWTVRSGGAEFLLAPTPSGGVGWFPEQQALRARVAERVRRAARRKPGVTFRPRVLDLFGHTGGTAMAAAGAGAEVTMVDGARGTIGWARRNFERNGLGEAPIRSIAEDVGRFVEREARRGARYDAIVLDPPSFGRGPKGRTWKIERDLDGLLRGCTGLLGREPLFLLVTAHTEAWRMGDLAGRLDAAAAVRPGETGCGDLTLPADDGRRLRAGIFAWRDFS
jgi:23S rRNA (cytosine1962-C5)-methyltransferase